MLSEFHCINCKRGSARRLRGAVDIRYASRYKEDSGVAVKNFVLYRGVSNEANGATGATSYRERMMLLRMLVVTLLAVLVMWLTIGTRPAEVSALDEAREFAQYMCETYLWCD
jgi:hypothetical protein